MRKFLLFFAYLGVGYCTLPGTLQWEVRSTGNDSSGGSFDPSVASPGTDYSQQDSSQIAYTDLVISVTTTQFTSALNPVTSLLVGNTIQIISGTGCTAGFYNIRSETASSPNFATVDRTMGTAASVCVANLGGGLLTIAKAAAGLVAFNTIWLKNATYTLTSVVSTQAVSMTLEGYNSTHGDNGTKPLITTSTNSTALIGANAGPQFYINLSLSNTAATPANGISYTASGGQIFIINCLFNFPVGSGTGNGAGAGFYNNNGANDKVFIGNEFKGTGYGVLDHQGNGGRSYFLGNYFHNTSDCWFDANDNGSGQIMLQSNVFSGCNYGFHSTNTHNFPFYAFNNVFYNSVHDGINIAPNGNTNETPIVINNNIFYANGGWGINVTTSGSVYSSIAYSNAYGNNTSGNQTGFINGIGDVTGISNPFVSAGTGNFTLLVTSTLKALGFPGITPMGTGYLDIGALQSSSAGTGSAPHAYVQ